MTLTKRNRPGLALLASTLTLSAPLAARAQDVLFKTRDGRDAAVHIVGDPKAKPNTEIWVDNQTARNPKGLTNVCLTGTDGTRYGSVTSSDTGPRMPYTVMMPTQRDMKIYAATGTPAARAKVEADAQRALDQTSECRRAPRKPEGPRAR